MSKPKDDTSTQSARTRALASEDPTELLTLAAQMVGTEKDPKTQGKKTKKSSATGTQTAGTGTQSTSIEQRSPLSALYPNVMAPDGEWPEDDYDQMTDDIGGNGYYAYAPPPPDMWFYGPPMSYGPMTVAVATPETDNDENAPLSGASAADALLGDPAPVAEQPGDDQEDLLAGYRDRLDDEDGPLTNEKLAEIANAIWKQGRNSTIMKETLAKYPRPVNVKCHRVDTNEEILQGLTRNPTAKKRDSRLRTAQGTVARACLPALKIAEAAMDWSMELDRKSIMSLALDELTLLSDTNQVINQLRRDLLKMGMQPRFQNLCKLPKGTDATQHFFGNNLADRIKAAAQGGRVARRPYGPSGSFFGPMRGARRARGSQGYNRPYTYTYGRGRGEWQNSI